MRRRMLMVFALTIAGCSTGNPLKSGGGADGPETVNQQEAVKAWDQFILTAKARKKGAASLWEMKYDKGDLDIDFLRNDVKLDTARGVMVGEVQLKADEFTLVSFKNELPGGGIGKGVGNFCEYTLRFRYNKAAWVFVDGTRIATDIHDKTKIDKSGVSALSESQFFHLNELFRP